MTGKGRARINRRGRGALARFRGCRPRKLSGRCPHPRGAAVAKKAQPPRRLPSPWTSRERDRELLGMTHTQKNHRPGERREKRCGSEWLQKDQKQNRQQKRADHAVNDAELAARRGSRFILERDNPPVKPEMKAQ